MSDKIVLSYNDSLIYESDLELLNDGQWLNDRIIGFYYEYLDLDVHKNEEFSFLNPSTVQYLKMCNNIDEARLCFLDPLGLENRNVILFPLNNSVSVESAGGSHWSLLIYLKKESCFYHLDSIGSNKNEAKTFYMKYKDYFKAEKLIESLKNFPRQSNSSDCGVYLLAATELISNQCQNEVKSLDQIDFMQINTAYCSLLRKKIRQTIENLKQ